MIKNELEIKAVPFMGAELMAARADDGTIYAGVSYICNGMGMNKNEKDRQIKNVQSDDVLCGGCVKFDAGVFDPHNPTIALKLEYVPLWLAKISITPAMKTEKPELAERLIQYQLKAKDVLASAFLSQNQPCTLVEMFAMQAQINLESERKLHALEGKLDDTNKRFEAVTSFVTSPLTEVDTWQERMTRHIRRAVEQFGLNYQQFHAQLYEELERAAGVDLQIRQTRLRKRMMDSGATKTECKNVSKLSIVAADKKLRAMFETLLRNEIVRLAASSSVNA